VSQDLIQRREAIRRVAALLGGVSLVGGTSLLAACGAERPESGSIGSFTGADVALLDEIAETIIPTTDTPGAKAARTGAFMALMVTEAYKPEDAKVFRDGLGALDEAVRAAGGTTFMAAAPVLRTQVLDALDAQQHAFMKDKAKETPAHWFRMAKELTLTGYFTSEIGMTQALRYVETPGRFDPCATYAPGEKAWAPHA
jgi:hypothetical protein